MLLVLLCLQLFDALKSHAPSEPDWDDLVAFLLSLITLVAAACPFCLQLFEALKSRAPGEPDWDDLVAFLQEFCSLAKHLQLLQRQNLWNKMTQLGMFEVRARVQSASPLLL